MRVRLAALDHARREFIANASHELRTPLFSLGGFLELLTEEELDEETRREFLRRCASRSIGWRSSRRSCSTSRAWMRASCRSSGSRSTSRRSRKPSSTSSPCSRGRASIRSSSRRPGRRRGARRRAARAPDRADPGRERARAHAAGDDRVGCAPADGVLAVEDDGPGIPPEHVEHVFERFYRGGGRLASGSGLGLAIARELARAMGGALELESVPGGRCSAAASGRGCALSGFLRVQLSSDVAKTRGNDARGGVSFRLAVASHLEPPRHSPSSVRRSSPVVKY